MVNQQAANHWLCLTGVNVTHLKEVMSAASGGIIGTHFKVDGITWNLVDAGSVKRFMDVVNSIR
jgi:uncharacterized protein